MLDRIFSNTRILEKSIDATWKINQTISHNISNVDTPGYRKKKVVFQEALADALDKQSFRGIKTRKDHIRIGSTFIEDVEAEIVEVKSTKMRVDESNVDIDAEMVSMASNTILHHALVQKMNGELQRLKSIINEGRR